MCDIRYFCAPGSRDEMQHASANKLEEISASESKKVKGSARGSQVFWRDYSTNGCNTFV